MLWYTNLTTACMRRPLTVLGITLALVLFVQLHHHQHSNIAHQSSTGYRKEPIPLSLSSAAIWLTISTDIRAV